MSINLRKQTKNFLARREIKKVKQEIAKQQYPPYFNPEKWEKARGCTFYSYVLDIPFRSKWIDCWLPGLFSQKDFESYTWSSIEEVLINLKKDLNSLGFCYRDDDNHLKKGEWKIAMYYLPVSEKMPPAIYMIRQDQDGRWSEKRYWNSRPEIISLESDNPPNLFMFGMVVYKTLIVKKANN